MIPIKRWLKRSLLGLLVGSPMVILSSVTTHGCTNDALSVLHQDSSVRHGIQRTPVDDLRKAYQRPLTIPYPPENGYTKERELLGRTLFFDPRLSGSNFISCSSCHNPGFSWGDGLPKAIGHGMKQLARRTPTVSNLAWTDLLFWDGRAEGLEAQALGPIESPDEMSQNLEALVPKLVKIAGYENLFERAYPGEGITLKTIAKALATFQRSLVSSLAPFDQWVVGKGDAISEAAKNGFLLFNAKGKCVACHNGWNFTDSGFHDIGLASADIGRGKFLPGVKAMKHAFKTPTLRNVTERAPYMHDGSLFTLKEVIEYYNKGGSVSRESKAPEIKPLGLTESEVNDLVTFLKTLTSADPPMEIPNLPR